MHLLLAFLLFQEQGPTQPLPPPAPPEFEFLTDAGGWRAHARGDAGGFDLSGEDIDTALLASFAFKAARAASPGQEADDAGGALLEAVIIDDPDLTFVFIGVGAFVNIHLQPWIEGAIGLRMSYLEVDGGGREWRGLGEGITCSVAFHADPIPLVLGIRGSMDGIAGNGLGGILDAAAFGELELGAATFTAGYRWQGLAMADFDGETHDDFAIQFAGPFASVLIRF